MIRIAKRIVASGTVLAAMSACVVWDGRSSKESPSKEGPALITGRFATKAVYVSKKMSFTVSSNLAQVMRLGDARAADTVTIVFTEGEGLSLRFEKNSAQVLSKVYRFDDGLKVTDAGRIELPSTDRCDAGLVQGIPSAGCQSRIIALYSNASGDLIAVETHTAGVILGIIPVGTYHELIAIFPRVAKDACDFVRRGLYSCDGR